MVVHVGIYPYWGRLSYYNESEKVTFDIKINPVDYDEIEKIPLMFDEIKFKINGKLGNVCIFLYMDYGNEMRRIFVESGLKFGFKNVEVINEKTGFYLDFMSQINFKPLNGNIIWILFGYHCYVWKIENWKSKFICNWEANTSKLCDLRNLMIQSKMKEGPDFILYENESDKTILSRILSCPFFSFNYDLFCLSRGSLTKARISAGDFKMAHLETEKFLSQKICIKMGNKKLATFPVGHKLPLFYAKVMTRESEEDLLEIDPESGESEIFELPNFDEIYFTFQIDQYEIYSVKFEELPNEYYFCNKNEEVKGLSRSDVSTLKGGWG